ncbi:MAG: N-acetylmuramoyl-L-alanine amidase [Clostridia bacterium]|nr:N-acetylmuramoyl-L-alanine amidase [Clostridia bacterium]
MLFVVKKKTLIIALVALLSAISVFSIGVSAKNAVSASLSQNKTVVIDAGHGGIDGGVVGKNTGIKESQINLAVAKSLKNYLERNGYRVILTRENNDGLYEKSASNKKRSDMENRRKIIENAVPDMVVSVHQNYYPLSSVSGAQVFYGTSEVSCEYARVFQAQLNANLNCSRVAKEGDYYILNCTAYPSLIVECGFLSNPAEERLLVKATYQKKIAYAMFLAIHSILGESEHAHP